MSKVMVFSLKYEFGVPVAVFTMMFHWEIFLEHQHTPLLAFSSNSENIPISQSIQTNNKINPSKCSIAMRPHYF